MTSAEDKPRMEFRGGYGWKGLELGEMSLSGKAWNASTFSGSWAVLSLKGGSELRYNFCHKYDVPSLKMYIVISSAWEAPMHAKNMVLTNSSRVCYH